MKSDKRSLSAKIGIVVLVIISIGISLFLKLNVPDNLRINEIAFSLKHGVDWIEIYNPTMNNLSLEGLYLSDKEDNLTRFKINKNVVVPSHGFVIIYCDGYKGDLKNSIVTNFRISEGETVYLVDKDGITIIDSMTVEKDGAPDAHTLGRFPNGQGETFFMPYHTPGEPNVDGFFDPLKENDNE